MSSASTETAQSAVWKGQFGRDYTDRNTCEPEALDTLYLRNYGISRRAINQTFLQHVPQSASFLEVGCNTGNQLLLLQEMGYSNLCGVELQPYAIELARKRLAQASLSLGSALSLPYEDSSFEVVFTSGVLIHISPDDLPRALDEIHRCSRAFIWGLEYFSSDAVEIHYRNRRGLLWKMDYARRYLERFDDLELVQEQRLPYLQTVNQDTVFLLKKSH
jgi:pseudaminic acid biosynthesis-associated methylase